MRIGYGFDVHRLVEGRELWIGGVKIDHDKGLRDIGYHFPDSDPQYKGIDSRRLLREVMRLINEKGYVLGNCDITICAEAPKMNPHIPAMQAQLAECMNCDPSQVSIKATTTERLGYTGRGEGIAAHAVALIMLNA